MAAAPAAWIKGSSEKGTEAVAATPLKFGYYYYPKTDTADPDEPLFFGGETHVLVLGVNGAGKSTRLLIENLAYQLRDRSIVVFDVKGELAAQTQRARRLLGDDVKIINPYNLHDLGSDGYNPLAGLRVDDEFYDKCKEIARAIIEVEGDTNKFFPQSAQGWFCAGMMWEVVQARREKRVPSLLRAREWCLEPDEYDGTGRDAPLIKGVRVNAHRMVKEGGREIANLAGRFDKLELTRGDHDVLQTLNTETEFLVSPPIARDLEKGNWSFAQLKQRPTTVFVCLPPNQMQDKRRWTRTLMTTALHAHLQPGPLRTLFVMDEFRVSIGHLAIVNDFWALVRGYGVQFMPICQSPARLGERMGALRRFCRAGPGLSGCKAWVIAARRSLRRNTGTGTKSRRSSMKTHFTPRGRAARRRRLPVLLVARLPLRLLLWSVCGPALKIPPSPSSF
jgi:type IV secretion system protein VirD4